MNLIQSNNVCLSSSSPKAPRKSLPRKLRGVVRREVFSPSFCEGERSRDLTNLPIDVGRLDCKGEFSPYLTAFVPLELEGNSLKFRVIRALARIFGVGNDHFSILADGKLVVHSGSYDEGYPFIMGGRIPINTLKRMYA